eukprot:314659-Hanusia_phi.AAC.1
MNGNAAAGGPAAHGPGGRANLGPKFDRFTLRLSPTGTVVTVSLSRSRGGAARPGGGHSAATVAALA